MKQPIIAARMPDEKLMTSLFKNGIPFTSFVSLPQWNFFSVSLLQMTHL